MLYIHYRRQQACHTESALQPRAAWSYSITAAAGSTEAELPSTYVTTLPVTFLSTELLLVPTDNSCFPRLLTTSRKTAPPTRPCPKGSITWISRAWYTMMSPSKMIVERLIRHFRAREYSDSCNTKIPPSLSEPSARPPPTRSGLTAGPVSPRLASERQRAWGRRAAEPGRAAERRDRGERATRSRAEYLGVGAPGQLGLDDHDDDAEHAEDERVVAEPLPLLEQRTPVAQSVPDVLRFAFGPFGKAGGRGAGGGAVGAGAVPGGGPGGGRVVVLAGDDDFGGSAGPEEL